MFSVVACMTTESVILWYKIWDQCQTYLYSSQLPAGTNRFEIQGPFIFAIDKVVNVWCDLFLINSNFEIYLRFVFGYSCV